MNESGTLDHVVVMDGKSQHPIHMNLFIMMAHLACTLVGIPTNGFIFIKVLMLRHLRTKPRNIFLLGLLLSNLTSFIPVFVQFIYFYYPSDLFCQIYQSIIGLPYALFLTNVLLALIDRYTAIAYPLWHMKKATVPVIVVLQVGASLSVCVIYKFAYITQLLPLRCESQLIQVKVIAVTLLVLFSSCICGQVIVYRQTRKILTNCKTRGDVKVIPFRLLNAKGKRIAPSQSNDVHQIDFLVMENESQLASRQQKQTSSQLTTSNDSALSTLSDKLTINVSNHSTISQLEIEACHTLVASVTSLSIMTGPFIVYSFTSFICRLCYDKNVCNSITWLAPYFKELVVFHAVYHPLIYLFRSTELSNAMKRKFVRR